MSRIIIEEVRLNRPTEKENLQLVEKWISDTTEKLNLFIKQVEERSRDGNNG